MLMTERLIVRIWGHSSSALGLICIPTLLFTLVIAVLATLMPERKAFWFGVWLMCGMLQAAGAYAALRIQMRYSQTKG